MAEPDPGALAAGTRLRRLADAGPGRGRAAAGRAAAAGGHQVRTGGGHHVLHPGRAGAGHPAGGRGPARPAVRRRRRTPGGRSRLRHRVRRAGLRPGRSGGRRRGAGPGHRGRGRGQPGRVGAVEVVCADVEEVAAGLLSAGRRRVLRPGPAGPPAVGSGGSPTSRPRGRWSPGCWTGGGRPGSSSDPALPHDLVPPDAEAEWLTDRGDTVEVGLWAGPGVGAGAPVGAGPGRRRVAPAGHRARPARAARCAESATTSSNRSARCSGPAGSARSARRWAPACSTRTWPT